MGLPTFRASRRASSSWRSRIRKDARVRTWPRARAAIRDHGPSSNARAATSTARRASSGPASATSQAGSPVAGSTTLVVAPSAASTRSPPSTSSSVIVRPFRCSSGSRSPGPYRRLSRAAAESRCPEEGGRSRCQRPLPRGGRMRLEGKVALITGGGSGMGKVASELFAREGANVVLTDVNDDAGKATASAIGDGAHFVHADVSREADAQAMVAAALEHFGRLDVLYNNAGVMLPEDGSVATTDESIWDTTLAVNVKGVAFGCKYGIPAMLDTGGGSVINVASFVAWMGAATSQTAYTASKGAVLSMTREIAVEYARKGIRCNALCPGPIETPLLMQLLSDEEKRQRRFVHIPMGRLGQADELAKAALFLASDDASFMTGASLIVDGGITAAYVTPEE